MRAAAAIAACRNSLIFLWSFLPGALSMREQASTPQGCASAMACGHVGGIQAAGQTIMRPRRRAASVQSNARPAPP